MEVMVQPLSVAALISGMLTLVATAPNLVVNAELMRQGAEGFNFFSFTPFGLPILVLGILYMLFARRMLADGLFDHKATSVSPGKAYTYTVTIPNTPCTKCTMQLLQFMANHPLDPSYFAELRPIDDVRGSAEYRRAAAREIVGRALAAAAASAPQGDRPAKERAA